MTNNPEQPVPIEQLLDDVDAYFAPIADDGVTVFDKATAMRLVHELRQRLEREQQLGFRVKTLKQDIEQVQHTSMRFQGMISTLETENDELRQRIEKEKQSDVEVALAELITIRPLMIWAITVGMAETREGGTIKSKYIIVGTHRKGDNTFSAETLSDAMQKVRTYFNP